MRTWTPKMVATLRREYLVSSNRNAIAHRLGVSMSSLKTKAARLRLVRDRQWTKAQKRTLRAKYETADVGELAAELGRGIGAIYQQAAKMGLHKPNRPHAWPKRLIARVKLLFRAGHPDRVIAERCKITYDQAKHIRQASCSRMCNRDMDAKRRSIENQRKTLGFQTPGQLRAMSYRRFAAESGWPEDLRARETQILNLLAARGIPMSLIEIATALGMRTDLVNCVTGSPKPLSGNGPGGSYTATLARRGLIVRLVRALHIHGQGKGRSKDLYTLGPAALAILQERACKQQETA